MWVETALWIPIVCQYKQEVWVNKCAWWISTAEKIGDWHFCLFVEPKVFSSCLSTHVQSGEKWKENYREHAMRGTSVHKATVQGTNSYKKKWLETGGLGTVECTGQNMQGNTCTLYTSMELCNLMGRQHACIVKCSRNKTNIVGFGFFFVEQILLILSLLLNVSRFCGVFWI